MTLDDLRRDIDRVDEVLVRLLNERARCVCEIGRLKKEQGASIYEPQREAAVMAHIKEVNAMLGGPLDEGAIVRLYERIMDEARRIQRIEAKHDPEPAPTPDDLIERE